MNTYVHAYVCWTGRQQCISGRHLMYNNMSITKSPLILNGKSLTCSVSELQEYPSNEALRLSMDILKYYEVTIPLNVHILNVNTLKT